MPTELRRPGRAPEPRWNGLLFVRNRAVRRSRHNALSPLDRDRRSREPPPQNLAIPAGEPDRVGCHRRDRAMEQSRRACNDLLLPNWRDDRQTPASIEKSKKVVFRNPRGKRATELFDTFCIGAKKSSWHRARHRSRHEFSWCVRRAIGRFAFTAELSIRHMIYGCGHAKR